MKDAMERAEERRLDWGLGEVLGDERPPDLTERVLARARAGEAPDAEALAAGGHPHARTRRRWLAAALILLASGIAVGVALLQEGGQQEIGDGDREARRQDPEPRTVPVFDLKGIRRLPENTRAIYGFNLGDEELGALARFPRLEILDLNWRRRPGQNERPGGEERHITDAGLEALGGIPSLRVLVLSGNPGVKGPGLRHLSGLPRLERLSLAHMDTADRHLAILRALPSLRYLDLSYNHGFTDEGMQHAAALPGLRTLKLRACSQLEPDTVERVAGMEKLEVLDLGGIDGLHWRQDVFFAQSAPKPGKGVTDRVVMSLMELENLRELDLSDCTKVHSEALKGLTELRGLQKLELRNLPELADGAMLYLPVSVRILDLTDCDRIGDGAMRLLAQRLPGLRELRVDRCHGVTDAGLAEVLGACRLQVLTLSLCLNVQPALFEKLLSEDTLTELDVSGLSWWTEQHSKRLQEAVPRLERLLDNRTKGR